MTEGLNIVVLVKVVPKSDQVKMDPETNTLDRRDAESIINPPDKNAVETAVSLKEKYGGKVTLMSMAPPFVDDFMRLMIAMGADDAILLSDRAFAMADTYQLDFAGIGNPRRSMTCLISPQTIFLSPPLRSKYAG